MRKINSTMDLIDAEEFTNLLFCHDANMEFIEFMLYEVPDYSDIKKYWNTDFSKLKFVSDDSLLNQGFYILGDNGEKHSHYPWWLSIDKRCRSFRWGIDSLKKWHPEVHKQITESEIFRERFKNLKKYL